jgi:hypothetical protein
LVLAKSYFTSSSVSVIYISAVSHTSGKLKHTTILTPFFLSISQDNGMSGSSRDASLASSNKQVGVELISLEKSRSPRRKLWHKKRRESVEGTLLTEENAPQGLLARDFSESKKWVILNVIAFLQISMNLNASIFGSANHALRGKWKISELRCRMFQGFFLIAYAFG